MTSESFGPCPEEAVAQILALCARHDIAVQSTPGRPIEVSFFPGRPALITNPAYFLRELEQLGLGSYRPVPGYAAAVDLSGDIIEATLLDWTGGPWKNAGHNLMAIGGITDEQAPGRSIEITYGSGMFSFLSRPFAMLWAGRRPAVLVLRGFGATSPDDAQEILDDVATGLLFEIAMDHGFPLALERIPDGRSEPDPDSSHVPTLRLSPPTMPKRRYDHEPATLHGYAISAVGRPLLQFLAFYQALEYYFPRYAAAARAHGRHVRSERDQMRETLRACVETAEIVAFLDQEENRREALARTAYPLELPGLIVNDRSRDLRDDAADRVYALRCKIVHVKDGRVDLLLPTSPEAQLLGHDIALVRLFAERVIVASSRVTR